MQNKILQDHSAEFADFQVLSWFRLLIKSDTTMKNQTRNLSPSKFHSILKIKIQFRLIGKHCVVGTCKIFCMHKCIMTLTKITRKIIKSSGNMKQMFVTNICDKHLFHPHYFNILSVMYHHSIMHILYNTHLYMNKSCL